MRLLLTFTERKLIHRGLVEIIFLLFRMFRGCEQKCRGCQNSIGMPHKLKNCKHLICLNCVKNRDTCPHCGEAIDKEFEYKAENDQDIR